MNAQTFKVVARNRDHLLMLIEKNIDKFGPNCDLNYIDVSQITSMNRLFQNNPFNGDISEWNVSKVTDMNSMFYGSRFNGDINKWNVSNVTDMDYIFNFGPLKKNPPHWYK